MSIAICISFMEKGLFRSFAHFFKLDCLVFLVLSFLSYFWILTPCQMCRQILCALVQWVVFSFCWRFLCCANTFQVDVVPVVILFSFISFAWGDLPEKMLPQAMSEILLPIFSSGIFMGTGPTFKSLIHFEFILVYSRRSWSSFLYLHVSVQFSQLHLMNKLSLAHCMYLLPVSNINWL